jgi:hypothetical protein
MGVTALEHSINDVEHLDQPQPHRPGHAQTPTARQPIQTPKRLTGPASLLHLQRLAGNRAVTQVAGIESSDSLVRDAPSERPRQALPRPGMDSAAISRDASRTDDVYVHRRDDAEFGRLAAESDNRFLVDLIGDWTQVSEPDRLTIIQNMLGDRWVGPLMEGTIEDIWNSFGRDRIEALLAHRRWRDVWKRSLDRGAELYDISALSHYRGLFERDVKAVANGFMQKNKQLVEDEEVRLGLRLPAEGVPAPSQDDQNSRVGEIQKMVESLEEIRALQQQLRSIPVGRYKTHGFRGRGDYFPPEIRVQHFNPLSNGPPEMAPEPDDVGFQQWDDVKPMWDQLGQALMLTANLSPAAYGALVQDRLDDVSVEQSPDAARSTMTEILSEMYGNINSTITALDEDDLDWRELAPVHAMLYRNAGEGATSDWSSFLMKGIGEDLVEDHKDRQFWISLGLGTLAAAAFIFSFLATAGLSTVAWAALGIGLSATQAAMSWENYDDLATAAGAGAGSETEVVSDQQVQAARIQAIIDTVFAFVDLATPFKPLGRLGAAFANRSIRVAGREAAEVGLRGLGELGEAEARAVIEKSVREIGIRETLVQSGLTEAQLLARSSDSQIVRRGLATLAEQGGLLNRLGLVERMGRLSELPMAEREETVGAFLELFGPERALREAGGWEQTARLLGNESPTGGRLMAWREGIYNDTKRFVEETLEGQVERTGRSGSFSNDLDLSLMGENAVANAEKARQFLAARAGSSAGEIERLLDAGIMTDPTRMHIYDLLDEGASVLRETVGERVLKLEEELVFARRLHEARGDAVMESAIRQEMAEAGIREVPWRQLSAGERGQLAAEIDRLHASFVTAREAGDSGTAALLAEEIAQKQSLLNASSPGAYYTGGSVRRWVTERELLGGFGPEGTRPAAMTPQRIADIGNQTDELHHAVRQLLSDTATDTDIAGLLKKFGKYGDRLSTAAAEAAGVSAREWEQIFEPLAQRFKVFQEAFEGGHLASLSRGELLEVRANALRLLGDLTHHSGDFVAVLRRQLGEAAAEGAGLAAVQTAVRNHLALMRAGAALRTEILKGIGRWVAAAATVPGGDETSHLAPSLAAPSE